MRLIQNRFDSQTLHEYTIDSGCFGKIVDGDFFGEHYFESGCGVNVDDVSVYGNSITDIIDSYINDHTSHVWLEGEVVYKVDRDGKIELDKAISSLQTQLDRLKAIEVSDEL